MKYWKPNNFWYSYIASVKDQSTTHTEITKEEYDKAVTLPKLAQDNISHQFFQNAETGLRKEKQRYKGSLYTTTQVTLTAVVPLGTKFVTNVEHITNANIILRDNLDAYLFTVADVDLLRSTTYYNAIVNGDDTVTAKGKAEAITVETHGTQQAIDGEHEFLQWLLKEHPGLSTFTIEMKNLQYASITSEDEPYV